MLERRQFSKIEEELALRRAIENSLRVGAAAVGPEGMQTYVNPAFCAMVGYREEELLGARPPFVYWPAEEADRIQAALQATIEGKAPAEGFELRFSRRSGERFDALVSISGLVDASGGELGWLATIFDIEKRKRAEERLRLALDAGRMGAWEWNVKSGGVTWSPELQAIHGLERGAFDGTFEAFQRDIHPEDRERVLGTIEGTVREGREDYQIEYRILRPDGEMRWLEARGKVFRDSSGAPLRMLGICSDITERKRLDESRDFLAEAAGALSSSLDPDENLKALARLAVPRISDWCAIHVAREDGELTVVEIAHGDPDKKAMVWELLRRSPLPSNAPYGPPLAIRTGQSILRRRLTPELKAVPSLGSDYRRMIEELQLCSSMIVPLKARNRTFGAITLVSAESKREYGPAELVFAEELAGRAALAIDNSRLFQEARHAVQARDEMMAVVSHDLRNPLQTIMASCSLLELDLSPEKRPDVAAAIRRSAKEMERLIEDLLVAARIEAGELSLALHDVDLSSVLAESLALFQPLADEKSVRLDPSVQP
ncbi:MAG: PAS domain S-box protein, partial [Vicinamibacteria bacterium]